MTADEVENYWYDGTFYSNSFCTRLLFSSLFVSICMAHLVDMDHTDLGCVIILWLLTKIETISDAIKKEFFSWI